MAKVYWHGRHPSSSYSSPLGKLHKQGLQHLTSLGWRCISISEEDAIPPIVPAFAWTTRKAGDFPASGPHLPLVRPLPQANTACLDDKVLLARLALADGRLRALCPTTHIEFAVLWDELQKLDGPTSASFAQRRWFVKHRHGVKGRAVQPMRLPSLLTWLQAQRAADPDGTAAQYVVQEEVTPPALWEGRKFAVRCHALVAAQGRAPPRAWLHSDVIILPHARDFDATSDDRAVHISQAGKAHPPPTLASLVPDDHPAAEEALWPRLKGLVGSCLRAAAPALFPSVRCEVSTLYSVLACDVALDARGMPFLLEVNSHCAIADGTMAAVPKAVYTRLVADVTSLLVLPALRERGSETDTVALTPEAASGGGDREDLSAAAPAPAQDLLAERSEAVLGLPQGGFEPLDGVMAAPSPDDGRGGGAPRIAEEPRACQEEDDRAAGGGGAVPPLERLLRLGGPAAR